jgi:sec-independent protein translocase protein TatA
MNVFGIGLPELAVIAAIGLLVFGPKRLPELGKTLGKTLKGFQSASSEFEKEFRKAVDTVETEVTAAQALPPEAAVTADTPASEASGSEASAPQASASESSAG